jgi:hypothetical protein
MREATSSKKGAVLDEWMEGEEPRVEGSVEIEVPTPDALSAIVGAEIDIQIATAKKYPRSLKLFRQNSLTLATLDQDTAQKMFYTLKRKNSDGQEVKIQGESIRLAEICAVNWQNMRYGGRVIDVGDKWVKAQGVAFDLENNVASSIETLRRITYSSGRRYSEDMIMVTAGAATSIAVRNAVLKVIPRALIRPIYEKALQVAIGDASTLKDRRKSALEQFAELGVSEERVLAKLGRKGIEEITLGDLEILFGQITAIDEHLTTVEESFPEVVKSKLDQAMENEDRKAKRKR